MSLQIVLPHRYIAAFTVVILGLVMGTSVRADVLRVPGEYPTIQAAIDAAAQAGDEVIVAPGIYVDPVDLGDKEIYLHSSDGPERTKIDTTVLQVTALRCTGGQGPDTIIEGFTFKSDLVRDAGGGILIQNASPTVRDCIFRDGSMWDGGVGMSIEYSNTLVESCLFINNETDDWAPGGAILVVGGRPTIRSLQVHRNVSDEDDGGAIAIQRASDATIIDCFFQDNDAGYGGAIHVESGSNATFERCYFLTNCSGWGWGGAIACDEAESLMIRDCTFIQNEGSNYGGAIFARDTNLIELVNCLFSGNGGNSLFNTKGGAIYLRRNSNVTVANCTFTENTAELGGGIYVEGNSHLVVSNSILWDNSADGAGDEIFIVDGTSTVLFRYSEIRGSGGSGSNWNDLMGADGGGNIDADPMFADPAYGNMRLLSGSPCIDAGINSGVPDGVDRDLFNNPRFIDSRFISDTGDGNAPIVDMGAYENQANVGPRLRMVPDPLRSGARGIIAVTDARSEAETYLVYSVKGPGELHVPFLNVTLGIRAPRLAGNAKMSDEDGIVYWSLPIPNNSVGVDLWLQAVQMNVKTDVVATRIVE